MEELCGGFMKINQKQIRRGRTRKNQEAHSTFLQQPSTLLIFVPERIYRMKQIATYPRQEPGPIPKSPATIWADVKAGRFPAPVRIGPNSVGWRGEDLQAWLDSLETTASIRR